MERGRQREIGMREEGEGDARKRVRRSGKGMEEEEEGGKEETE